MQAVQFLDIVRNLDVGTAPRHIGRHCNRPEFVGICNNGGFFVAAHGVNNATMQALVFDTLAQNFAFVDNPGAYQNRSTFGMQANDFFP